MAFFDKLFGRKQIDSSAALARVLIGRGTSKAGAAVNLESALRTSTVLACSRAIAEGVAQTPFKLFRSENGGRIAEEGVKVARLFDYAPNDWMTPFELTELLVMHLVLCGNAYVFKTLSSTGEILELLPLQPGWVTVKHNDDWSIEYRVKFPGRPPELVPGGNIWHLRGPAWQSYIGLDMVALARDAIGIAIATEEFGSTLFSKGARPGGILSTEQTLDEEAASKLRTVWAETHEGSGNAMKTAVLSGGMKFESMSMTSDEAQFIETRRYAVEEICRFMRVLPVMVGHSGDKAEGFASTEQKLLAHVVHTLMPWFVRIEQSAKANLLTADQRREGLYFKFLPNGLMRGAAKDRAEFYAKALGSGGSPAWMTQDEIRALEELNPLGGTAALLPVATNVAAPAVDPTE